MRVVVKDTFVTIPSGIWCYRVDPERLIMGGAFSNGSSVFCWEKRTFQPFQLPSHAEEQIASLAHMVNCVAHFSGERSPHWRPDLRAVIAGTSLASKLSDILQAAS